MHAENIISLYNRTYCNCKFYCKNDDNEHLLNEIGVLRGIVYCMEKIIGEENINSVIDFQTFIEMINKQNELLAME